MPRVRGLENVFAVGLEFGDIVVAKRKDGEQRYYLTSVAPATGGLKGNQALLTNMESGDIRSRYAVNLTTVTVEELKAKLKAVDIVILEGQEANIRID